MVKPRLIVLFKVPHPILKPSKVCQLQGCRTFAPPVTIALTLPESISHWEGEECPQGVRTEETTVNGLAPHRGAAIMGREVQVHRSWATARPIPAPAAIHTWRIRFLP